MPACKATIDPNAPSWTADTAATPKRVASTRSKAVGVPPRWMCPRVVDPGLVPRVALDLIGQPGADPAESSVAELVGAVVPVAVRAARASGPSTGRAPSEITTIEENRPRSWRRRSRPHTAAEVEGQLGHEDLGGPAGDARVRGDPSGVPTHHLAHDDPVVRLRRRSQAVDRLRGDLHGGVEAEGDLGARQVVVDGLGHPDRLDTFAAEARRHAERVLATDRHHRVDAGALERRQSPRGTVLVGVQVRPRGAQHRAAEGQEVANAVGVERPRVPLADAAPPVDEADA